MTGNLVLKNSKVLLYTEMLYCLYYEEVNDILWPKESLKNGKIATKNILNLTILLKSIFIKVYLLGRTFATSSILLQSIPESVCALF